MNEINISIIRRLFYVYRKPIISLLELRYFTLEDFVPYCPPSRGGNSGGLGSLLGLDLSLSLTPFPFPEDPPLEPDPAILYGSSSGIGIPGRLRMSMADRGFLTNEIKECVICIYKIKY